MAADWKERLYGAYVSSGQAAHGSLQSAEEMFRPRRAFLTHLLNQHLPTDRSIRVLDLGCGHGTLLYFLARMGYQNIEGVDLSAEQIDIAHRLGIPQARLGTLADVLAREGDGSVDVVLAMDVFEHLTASELFDTLDDIRRVLKPGGMCLAHVPNAEGIFGMRIRFGDFTHEQAFTPSSARQVFLTAGFKSVKCFEDKPAVHGLASAARWLLWELGTLNWRLLLLAETGTRGAVLSQNMTIAARL